MSRANRLRGVPLGNLGAARRATPFLRECLRRSREEGMRVWIARVLMESGVTTEDVTSVLRDALMYAPLPPETALNLLLLGDKLRYFAEDIVAILEKGVSPDAADRLLDLLGAAGPMADATLRRVIRLRRQHPAYSTVHILKVVERMGRSAAGVVEDLVPLAKAEDRGLRAALLPILGELQHADARAAELLRWMARHDPSASLQREAEALLRRRTKPSADDAGPGHRLGENDALAALVELHGSDRRGFLEALAALYDALGPAADRAIADAVATGRLDNRRVALALLEASGDAVPMAREIIERWAETDGDAAQRLWAAFLLMRSESGRSKIALRTLSEALRSPVYDEAARAVNYVLRLVRTRIPEARMPDGLASEVVRFLELYAPVRRSFSAPPVGVGIDDVLARHDLGRALLAAIGAGGDAGGAAFAPYVPRLVALAQRKDTDGAAILVALAPVAKGDRNGTLIVDLAFREARSPDAERRLAAVRVLAGVKAGREGRAERLLQALASRDVDGRVRSAARAALAER